jgi:pimeloyl-ACP methyl ester carboxylesterase
MMTAPEASKTMVLSDGRTLGYTEYGVPTGTPIILFHGTPGSRLGGAMFDEVARAHRVHLVAADRPGYATSSPLPRGTLLGYVSDVVALADSLHLERFAVLGVSGGAPFALACAAKIPERVTCCGLMSGIGPLAIPHSMDGMASVNRIVFTLARFMPALVGTMLPGQIKTSMKSVQKYIERRESPVDDVSPTAFAQLVADQLEAVRTGGKGITFDMSIVARDWGITLERIETKVYMWHGAEDNLAPVALARYVAEHIPGAVIKFIPGAGHTGTFACAGGVIETLIACE